MVDEVRDGSTDAFFVTFTKDGVGVDLQIDGASPANALVDGDVLLYKWNPVAGISSREVDVSAEITKVDITNAPGEMLWTPQPGDTRCNAFSLVIRDNDGGGAFDENRIRGYSHGRFHATNPDDRSRFYGV